jgi:hypothetical protein
MWSKFQRESEISNTITDMDSSKLETVQRKFVIFQVLTLASMKMTAFWDIAPCSLVEVD